MKKIAFFGTKGSFHYLAAQAYFGKETELIECFSFLRCCEALKNGEVDNAIIAIENSLAGSLLPNYNLVNEYELKIVGEQYLKIGLNLVAQEGVSIDDLEYVHSHPMALAQCSRFLHEYPHIKCVEQGDTASCVKNINDNNLRNVGAIANTFASELYNVPVLAANVENNKYNVTRFIALSNETSVDVIDNKASVCFRFKDKVGKLSDMLTIITEHNVNLSKIQSVPVYGEINEYFFYLDVEWDAGTYDSYVKAMHAVASLTKGFSILGEYTKAIVPEWN